MSVFSRLVCVLFPFSCLLSTTDSQAQTIYKQTDEHGRVSYSDKPPVDAERVETRRYRVESTPLATLRFQSEGTKQAVWIRNLLPGPVEVEVRLNKPAPVASTPALPLRLVLKPLDETRALELSAQPGAEPSASIEVVMRSLPGSPAATHSDPLYRLPLSSTAWRLGQGFNGSFSHQDPESRFAIDLGVDEGTPVIAARDGVVMQVEDNFEASGLDRERFASRGNTVRILHEDGSMAIYGHLSVDSVVVRPGARVKAGQEIGASGNTGFSTGPHLHFAVQLNRGMRLESVPFRMQGLELAGAAR